MTSPPRPSRRRARAIALAGSLAFALALSEVLLAHLRPQLTFARLDAMAPRMYRPSEVGPFELLPGARTRVDAPEFHMEVAINRQGLRMDRQIAAGRPADGKRALVVGDSFTFGHGVAASEAFPQVAERLLREHGLEHAEVLNLGFALGASPDSYYAQLAHGERFDADVLVVEVFVGNDLTAEAETRWLDLDEKKLPRRVVHEFTTVDAQHRFRVRDTLLRYRIPLLRESHLFQGLARLLAGAPDDPASSAYMEAYSRIMDERLYTETWPDWMQRFFDDQVRCLVGLRDLARSRGQQFLVLVIPTLKQVYDIRLVTVEGRQVVAGRLRDKPADEVPQRRLAAAFKTAGIESLDVLPPLVAAHDQGLYFLQDGHFTARGNAIVGAALAADLERRGWMRH